MGTQKLFIFLSFVLSFQMGFAQDKPPRPDTEAGFCETCEFKRNTEMSKIKKSADDIEKKTIALNDDPETFRRSMEKIKRTWLRKINSKACPKNEKQEEAMESMLDRMDTSIDSETMGELEEALFEKIEKCEMQAQKQNNNEKMPNQQNQQQQQMMALQQQQYMMMYYQNAQSMMMNSGMGSGMMGMGYMYSPYSYSMMGNNNWMLRNNYSSGPFSNSYLNYNSGPFSNTGTTLNSGPFSTINSNIYTQSPFSR